MVRRLAEAEAGIDDEALPRDAGRERPLEGALEIREDLGNQVQVARLRPVVHHDERDAVGGRHARQPAVRRRPPRRR